MPILVTGASGFLGGRLAQMLCERGEEVVVLARDGSDLVHLSSTWLSLTSGTSRLRIIRGSLSDRAVLAEAVRGVGHIYHCAACSTDWAARETYFDTNVTGTRNLIAAARNASRLQRFLHVSTTDIYGYPVIPSSEEEPFVDAGLPYNRTKGEAEAAVWQAHREYALPVTVVRPATIYGPRGRDFTQEIATLLRQRLMATIDGGGAPGGFVYVDTVAEAMIDSATCDRTLGEAYNISGGSGATWALYLKLFAEQLGTRMPWIDLSFNAAMALARILEAPYRWIARHRWLHMRGRPLLTRHAVYLLSRNQEFPIAKAASAFGFAPKIALEEGIARSVAWLNDAWARKR